jgi:hypothetical protein
MSNPRSSILEADVVVIGGGLGGVAAAIAACRAGRHVVLTEETDWLGGQLTSQAVPPDEHPWVEQFGVTASYRRLRDGIRDYYRRNYPLRPEAAADPHLNPGAGRVSKLCHEPRVAVAVIDEMLAPYRSAGLLDVLMSTWPVTVTMDGARCTAVGVTDCTGRVTELRGKVVLDATETGDLLELGDVEYVVGAESQAQHGEPHAPVDPAPDNQQGVTFCFAVSHHEGENHVIDRPEMYDFWRSYTPEFWTGPLLDMLAPDPRTLEPAPRTIVPNPPTDPLDVGADQSADAGDKELWGFRRILARKLYPDGMFDSDVCLVNWPLNDYWLRPMIGDEGTREQALYEARQLSLSVLYWLQTEAPRPDGGTGYPGLRIRPDVTGTVEGLAKAPYIRESRRIKAVTTVVEQNVSAELLGTDGRTHYPDSVGVGSYRIDLHPSTGGDHYIDVASVPFEIPLGALIPVRAENLLPAGKNIGTTHITNGCYRLHPVEWNIGEVAGELAAHCLEHDTRPRDVQADPELFHDFAARLDSHGIERHWPEVHGY